MTEHNKLLEAVSQLDKGQRIRKPERNEPTIEVSEYHLIKSGISENKVCPEDLTKSFGQKGHQYGITKKLQYLKRNCKVIPKPLEKPAAERIKRIIGFDKTKKELDKWNAIIATNRTSEHLSFPLNNVTKIKEAPTTEFLKRFRLKSDLIEKLEEVTPSIKFNAPQEEEKSDKYKVTIQEMILKRKEAARLRALQSYKEAKAYRERKIKSKKFHRIQKKDRVKQQLKEFEELQKINPEEALTKLEQLDKSRAEERMSLRHKSTGQWAKNKQIRAKYDKNIRQELAEQLAISRGLTQKIRQLSSDEENEEKEEVSLMLSKEDKENPWMNKRKTESEVDEFIQSYRRYWDQKNQEKEDENIPKTDSESNPSRKPTLSENKSEKQNFDEASEENNSINLETEKSETKEKNKNLINFANQKIEGSENKEKSKNVSNSSNQKIEESETKEKNKSLINFANQKIEKSEKKEKNENLISSENQKTQEIVNIKKDNKKGNARCIIVSEELLEKKVKLCKKVTSNALQENVKNAGKNKYIRNNVCATSAWNVEGIEHNEETEDKHCRKKSKISKSIDEMFDLLEENLEHKKDVKLKEMKKKLEKKIKKQQKKMNEQTKKKRNEENKGDEKIRDLEFKNFNSKPILDQPLDETTMIENMQKEDDLTNLNTTNIEQELINKANNQETEIDPDKYLNIKPKYLKTQLPDVTNEGEDVLDNSEQEEETHRIMSEAFADDDVVEEFRKAKEEEIKNSQPEMENIDLNLPGWGSWSGPNIKKNKKSRKRKQTIIFNVPKKLPRKDENKGKVIIFEDVNEKLKEHLVSELPYPFTSIKDFEASLRAPISSTFVPQNAHLRLTQPAVKTKIGQIIEPMNEDVLVKKELEKTQRGNNKKNNKRFAAKNDKKRHK